MSLAFCPACFAEITTNHEVCPACDVAIDVLLSEQSFNEKLTSALKHPVASVRMRAIITFGNRRVQEAADALVDCAFDHPLDVVQGMAIIETLAKFPHSAAVDAAWQRLQEHPARPIRDEAMLQQRRSTNAPK